MISAVKMATSSDIACLVASAFTFTSKARITAYSFFFSFMMEAFFTSFLWTSPMPTSKTGIFISARKPSSASKDPKVLALTYTPTGCFSKPLRMLSKVSSTCSLSSSMSSSGPTTSISEPATASSRPGAQIFTPIDVLIFAWWTYSPLTLISFMGCGVSSARMVVTIGPFMPAKTIWSPSFSVPLTSTTSMVVPRPSMFFTSMTVHCSSPVHSSFSDMRFCVSFRSMKRRSGTPSPVRALVGMMDTADL
mmetsp:Transcript_13234/g.20967  ORF Transcript_13234/g.20967 Transcript_13234/m.20967 type:complete len:249 (-) Transcript_13234:2689-3435(-)